MKLLRNSSYLFFLSSRTCLNYAPCCPGKPSPAVWIRAGSISLMNQNLSYGMPGQINIKVRVVSGDSDLSQDSEVSVFVL